MSQFIQTIGLIFISLVICLLLYRLISPYKKGNTVAEWYQWLTFYTVYYPLVYLIFTITITFRQVPDVIFIQSGILLLFSNIIAIDYYIFHLARKNKWYLLATPIYIFCWCLFLLIIIAVKEEGTSSWLL
ncbi:MAG: hypothetical protein JST82_01295 [Bacteroidetes bacterium]|nr:hypothetical protein [Bacteroidota bacterium]